MIDVVCGSSFFFGLVRCLVAVCHACFCCVLSVVCRLLGDLGCLLLVECCLLWFVCCVFRFFCFVCVCCAVRVSSCCVVLCGLWFLVCVLCSGFDLCVVCWFLLVVCCVPCLIDRLLGVVCALLSVGCCLLCVVRCVIAVG